MAAATLPPAMPTTTAADAAAAAGGPLALVSDAAWAEVAQEASAAALRTAVAKADAAVLEDKEPAATIVSVQVPEGASGGSVVEISTPAGRRTSIILPAGSAPGDTIQVKLAPESTLEQLAALKAVQDAKRQSTAAKKSLRGGEKSVEQLAAAAARMQRAAEKRAARVRMVRPMVGEGLLGIFDVDSASRNAQAAEAKMSDRISNARTGGAKMAGGLGPAGVAGAGLEEGGHFLPPRVVEDSPCVRRRAEDAYDVMGAPLHTVLDAMLGINTAVDVEEPMVKMMAGRGRSPQRGFGSAAVSGKASAMSLTRREFYDQKATSSLAEYGIVSAPTIGAASGEWDTLGFVSRKSKKSGGGGGGGSGAPGSGDVFTAGRSGRVIPRGRAGQQKWRSRVEKVLQRASENVKESRKGKAIGRRTGRVAPPPPGAEPIVDGNAATRRIGGRGGSHRGGGGDGGGEVTALALLRKWDGHGGEVVEAVKQQSKQRSALEAKKAASVVAREKARAHAAKVKARARVNRVKKRATKRAEAEAKVAAATALVVTRKKQMSATGPKQRKKINKAQPSWKKNPNDPYTLDSDDEYATGGTMGRVQHRNNKTGPMTPHMLASTAGATMALQRSAQRAIQRGGDDSPFHSPVTRHAKLHQTGFSSLPGGAPEWGGGVSLREKGMKCTSAMLEKAGLSPGRALSSTQKNRPAYLGTLSPATTRRRKRQNRSKPWLQAGESTMAGGEDRTRNARGAGSKTVEGGGTNEDFWFNPAEERLLARQQRRAQAGHQPSPTKRQAAAAARSANAATDAHARSLAAAAAARSGTNDARPLPPPPPPPGPADGTYPAPAGSFPPGATLANAGNATASANANETERDLWWGPTGDSDSDSTSVADSSSFDDDDEEDERMGMYGDEFRRSGGGGGGGRRSGSGRRDPFDDSVGRALAHAATGGGMGMMGGGGGGGGSPFVGASGIEGFAGALAFPAR